MATVARSLLNLISVILANRNLSSQYCHSVHTLQSSLHSTIYMLIK